jgi:branched-subunit amino acid ABC-type transport system permease component
VSSIIQIVIGGLQQSAVFAIVALGVSLVFKVINAVNFFHFASWDPWGCTISKSTL